MRLKSLFEKYKQKLNVEEDYRLIYKLILSLKLGQFYFTITHNENQFFNLSFSSKVLRSLLPWIIPSMTMRDSSILYIRRYSFIKSSWTAEFENSGTMRPL